MLAHPLAAFSHYQAPLAFRMPTCGLLEHHTFIADGQSPFIKFLDFRSLVTMSQNTFSSTYSTYKQGTKRLTTWLVNAARRCGIVVTPSEGYEIPLGKFADLAKSVTVASNPKVDVPKEILDVLTEVIALRKETGKMLADVADSATYTESQVTHQYFISILEQVLEILSASPIASPPSSATESHTDQRATMSNMFAALSVEQTSAPEIDFPTFPTKK